MSTSTPPTHSGRRRPKRSRTLVACSNCRKRKIRCITSEKPPKNPCARCTKKNLDCEYLAIEDPDDYSPSPSTHAESDSGDSPPTTSFPESTAWNPRPIAIPELSRDLGATSASSIPPGASSNQPYPYAGYAGRRDGQFMTPPFPVSHMQSPHYAPAQANPRHLSSNPPALYDLQAAHARQYLANRARSSEHPSRIAQPHNPPPYYPTGYGQFHGSDTMLMSEQQWPTSDPSGYNEGSEQSSTDYRWGAAPEREQ
ncbi:hypothetical protein B0H11DRAFT_2303320 [Mycena galericulata]|nr:hypothetical protein B0H11DRAFT_2303320 [Mycena galericulata]